MLFWHFFVDFMSLSLLVVTMLFDNKDLADVSDLDYWVFVAFYFGLFLLTGVNTAHSFHDHHDESKVTRIVTAVVSAVFYVYMLGTKIAQLANFDETTIFILVGNLAMAIHSHFEHEESIKANKKSAISQNQLTYAQESLLNNQSTHHQPLDIEAFAVNNKGKA